MRLGPRPLLFLLCLATAGLPAAESPAPRFDRVEIAPTWTSIYIGTVSLRLPPLTRDPAGNFSATYAARVFPYFFSNETGRLTIQIPDAALARLARGEAIEFAGRAVNQQGEERRVEGKATPADRASGKIKVRVFVPPKIELIFNTTYRFPPE